MGSWRSSSDRSGRSNSPSSPLSPLPAHGLPQWLRSSRPSTAVIANGRYKVLLAAFTCIMLGWLMTTALGPPVQEVPEELENEYMASTGVLNDPAGYGAVDPSMAKPSLAVHHSGAPIGHGASQPHDNGPSIKGALGDLHKAVTHKIKGWKASGKTGKSQNGTLFGDDDPSNGPFNTTEDIHDGMEDVQRLGTPTRIGKCTILFGGSQYYERAIRTHTVHDRMHDYRLHVLRQHLMDDVWSKPAYILSLLLRELAKPPEERLEWIFWVDADVVLLNPYVTIETFLPPHDFDEVHLLYSEDWNGLNNGVFPVRVNKWAVELFSAIVAFRYYRPKEQLTFRDQSAMNVLMKEPKFAKNIMKLPQRWFNAYQGEHNETLAPYQIRRGDFLVHFAGVTDRDNRMNFWLDRADQHLDDWEVPLKSTSYPQEVKDFWSEQRFARANLKTGLTEGRLAATKLLTATEEALKDFSEKLSTEQTAAINTAHGKLKTMLADESLTEDLEKMTKLSKELEDASVPLTTVKGESHKVLFTAAHDAIFAAEKDLVEAGFYKGVTSPEASELDDKVKKLKEMVLASEETWDRATVTAALDAVTADRSKVQEMAASVAAAAASASASAAAAAASAAAEAQAAEVAKKLKEAQDLRAMQMAQAAPTAAEADAVPEPAENNEDLDSD